MQIMISVNDKNLIIMGASKVDNLIEKAIDNHDYSITRTIREAIEGAFSDVTPISEVEALLNEICEAISTIYHNASFTCHSDMKYGKTDTPNGMINIGIARGIKIVVDKIAEIKKKYKGRVEI